MTKKSVFTIVAKNYIGLAEILGASVKKNSPGTSFIIFIADEFDSPITFTNTDFTYLSAKDTLGIESKSWIDLAFKYNITEFCTAIKPYCFNYLMNDQDWTEIIYFDPDILVFSNLDAIWTLLQHKDVVITPHIVTPETLYSGIFPETNILATGIYNLGFIAVKKSAETTKFIAWWQNRLFDKCFIDKLEGLFTDQKWIDFLPALFNTDKIEVSKNLGFNAAPWNFYEREFTLENDTLHVVNRITGKDKNLLVFVHFSGFNYKNLEANINVNKNILNIKVYNDVIPVIKHYAAIIKNSNYNAYFAYTYTYNTFNNGLPITQFHRRLYRRLLIDGKVTGNPFIFEGKQTFYAQLKKAGLLLNEDAADPDKLNERNLDNFSRKLQTINKMNLALKRLLGPKYYFLFCKFMLRYYRPENQVFLIDRQYLKSSFKNEHY